MGTTQATRRTEAFDELIDTLHEHLIPLTRLQIAKRARGGYWVRVTPYIGPPLEHVGPSVVDAARIWLNAEAESLWVKACTWQMIDFDKAEWTA